MTSPGERYFIKNGVNEDVRSDGRSRNEFRYFSVEHGVIPHSNGSSRVRLDNTEVIISIIAEVVSPDNQNTSCSSNSSMIGGGDGGCISCAVECTSSAIVELEMTKLQTMNAQLSQEFGAILRASSCFLLDKMVIVPNKHIWCFHVDAMVLDNGGNLMDAILIGTRAAILTATLPCVEANKVEEKETLDNAVATNESSKIRSSKDVRGDRTFDLIINEDPMAFTPITDFCDVDKLPLTVTMTKIGNYFVVDATDEESQCMSVNLVCGVDGKGQICCVKKHGPGGVSVSAIREGLQVAKEVASLLIQRVDSLILGPEEPVG